MKPKLFTQTKLAEHFGLDRMTVNKRLREAGIEAVKKGARGELFYELTPELEDAIYPETRVDYEAERARKTKIDADLKQLELDQQRGTLVERREIQSDMQTIFTRLYQKLVNQMPRELSGALFRAESPEHCQAVLQKATAQVFSDLREEHEKILNAT